MNKDVSDELSEISTCNNEGLSYIERRLALRSRPASQQPPPSLPATQRRCLGRQVQQPEVTVQQDELAQYLSEPPVTNIAFKNDPIAWWRDVGVSRFPRLSYMAVDFLTIASSSAETERDFSSVGRMITPLRSRLRRSFVARAQCLRSWGKAGIYKPSIQFDLLNNANWRDVVATLAREDQPFGPQILSQWDYEKTQIENVLSRSPAGRLGLCCCNYRISHKIVLIDVDR